MPPQTNHTALPLNRPLDHAKQFHTHHRTVSASTLERLHRDITRHQYAADNIWQSYELYLPNHTVDQNPQFWILYIHGGYFRDDSVTAASFQPALAQLIKTPKYGLSLSHLAKLGDDQEDISSYVAGYASINYRLSPRPQKSPQGPKTPAYELRNAEWPDHVHDVLMAIAHLQDKYGFEDRYLLVGHSVGATMALLSTLSSTKPLTSDISVCSPKIHPPLAVLAVSGIYDFGLLHDSNPDSGYDELTRNAIRRPEDIDLASPARYPLTDYNQIWAHGGKKTALIVAHSKDDGLVDWNQVEAIQKVFGHPKGSDLNVGEQSAPIGFRVIEINGAHNDIWGHGTALAKVIRRAIRVTRTL